MVRRQIRNQHAATHLPGQILESTRGAAIGPNGRRLRAVDGRAPQTWAGRPTRPRQHQVVPTQLSCLVVHGEPEPVLEQVAQRRPEFLLGQIPLGDRLNIVLSGCFLTCSA